MKLTIDVTIDGNQVAAILGDVPENYVAGFGDTLSEALEELTDEVKKIEEGETNKYNERIGAKINSLSYLASGAH